MSEQEHEEKGSIWEMFGTLKKTYEDANEANQLLHVGQTSGLSKISEGLDEHSLLPTEAKGNVGAAAETAEGALSLFGLMNGVMEMTHAKDVQHGIGAGAETASSALALVDTVARATGVLSKGSEFSEFVPVAGQVATGLAAGTGTANAGLDAVNRGALLGTKSNSFSTDKDGNLVPVSRDFIDCGVDLGADFNHSVRDATGSELLGDIAGGVGGVVGTLGGAGVTVAAGLWEGAKKEAPDALLGIATGGLSYGVQALSSVAGTIGDGISSLFESDEGKQLRAECQNKALAMASLCRQFSALPEGDPRGAALALKMQQLYHVDGADGGAAPDADSGTTPDAPASPPSAPEAAPAPAEPQVCAPEPNACVEPASSEASGAPAALPAGAVPPGLTAGAVVEGQAVEASV
jgi:hypothetical protein